MSLKYSRILWVDWLFGCYRVAYFLVQLPCLGVFPHFHNNFHGNFLRPPGNAKHAILGHRKTWCTGKMQKISILKLGWWRKPELDILGPATWYQLSQWSHDQQLLSQQRKISRGFFERFPCRGWLHHPQIPALHPLCSINQPDFFVNSSLNRFREWSLVQPTARYIRILFGIRAKHQQRTHVTINVMIMTTTTMI